MSVCLTVSYINNWRAGGTLFHFLFFPPVVCHVGGIDGNSREMVSTADDSSVTYHYENV